jgi:hypothetical protein
MELCDWIAKAISFIITSQYSSRRPFNNNDARSTISYVFTESKSKAE